VERFGKRPKRSRAPLLETPRKKLSIEYSLMLEEGYRENRTCIGNCFSMIGQVTVKSQKEILLETKNAFSKANSEVLL